MTPAFLPADVSRALVEAGMVVDGEQLLWWWLSEGGWLLDCHYKPEGDGWLPAVTPLQALDWLVASGRITGWIGGGGTLPTDGWCAYTPDGPCVWFNLDGSLIDTPTDLVRAVLGMEVA